ncbi:MAG TPA: surface lipoprotein assembly modifier, partial [Burkholderiales bacterium]
RQTIERYLAAINEREKARNTLVTGFVELVNGYDSNVNNSTSQSNVAVPALGNLVFTLDASNIERHDTYTMLAGGAEISHRLRPGVAVFAGTGGRYRNNHSEDRFNIGSIDARAGVAVSGEKWLARVSGQGERFFLDDKRNRDSRGAATDLRYAFNDNWSGTAFLQYNIFRFNDAALQINDFNQAIGGLALSRALGSSRRVITASGYGGHENAINDRADGDKDFEGWRIAGQADLGESLDFFIAVGGQRGRYRKVNVAFETERRDKLYDGTVGLAWRIDQRWSLRPQCSYSKNDSNIAIYDYQRLDCSVSVRAQF